MEQTFLVYYYYSNDKEDFYRHCEKKLDTVLKQEKKFLNSYCWWIDKNDDNAKIVVYKTNYAISDDKIVYQNTIKKFMEV